MQASEKRLFLILCAAVFIALNLFGLRAFLSARKGLQKALFAATAQISSDRGLLAIGETLRPSDSWIASHPMPRLPAQEASALLLKTDRESAEKEGLKVTEENLLPTIEGPYGSSAGVSVKLAGSFAGVVRLLFSLQTPSSWRTIEKLALRSDSQPPNVVAELEIRQYFLPSETGSPSAPTAAP